jgi:hypothetical protein
MKAANISGKTIEPLILRSKGGSNNSPIKKKLSIPHDEITYKPK